MDNINQLELSRVSNLEKKMYKLRLIVFVLSLVLAVLSFVSIFSLIAQRKVDKENTELTAKLNEQTISLSGTYLRLSSEIGQLGKKQRIDDSATSIEGQWRRKLDSIERVELHNSVVNYIEAQNALVLEQNKIDNRNMFSDYLTHINTILVFFSILIALVSFVIPFLINKRTDEKLKELDSKQRRLTATLTSIARTLESQTDIITEISTSGDE